MNKGLILLAAFLGGAIAGAGTALLFAPEKGEELRSQIKKILRRRGILCNDSEIDELVEQLTIDLDE
ncbi:MAG: YtxH domain-containing protein [Muribaculaceae bacterium]|nr:YtxH domain-containing protein [Muribaculaceae bacterium]